MSTSPHGVHKGFVPLSRLAPPKPVLPPQPAARKAPAPAAPYLTPATAGTDTLTSAFTGAAGGDPNGTWSLYVVDDAAVDTGNIAGGWTLTLTQNVPVCNNACAGAPRIGVSSTLACNGANTVATVTISNTGTATANNVVLTTAKLGAVNGTPLPQSLGNLAPGASAVAVVTFSGAPSGVQTLQLGGTYSAGSFTSSRRVNAPTCNVALWPMQKVNPTLAAWLPAFALARQ